MKQISVVYFFNFKVEIDAINEGTREFLLIILDLRSSAFALMSGVAKIATGAGIHRGD